MEIIYKNPYRILGLPVTATEREIRKRIEDLRIFSEMGKELSYDTDLPFLSDIKRTSETIKEAEGQIDRPESRVFYFLFWFWIKNPVDEFVFDILKEGQVEKAIELWEKALNGEDVNNDNYSVLRNLSVLYMATSNDHGTIQENYLSRGIELSGKLFTSGDIENYGHLIVGNKYKIDKKKLQRDFIDQVITFTQTFLDKPQGISTSKFISYWRSFSDESYQYVVERYTLKPFRNIESEINNTIRQRQKTPLNCYQYGTKLNHNTKEDIEYLKTILPQSDYKFEAIADKIAEEILQCSIDLFNASIKSDSNYNAEIESLPLTKIAAEIAIGERAKQEIKKDLLFTENFIKESKRRKTRNNIIDSIVKQIDSTPDDIVSVNTNTLLLSAKNLINNCKPRLINLKKELQMDATKFPSFLFEDNFTDNKHGWIAGEDKNYSFAISDGIYILENRSTETSLLTWPKNSFNFGSMTGFTIECKLKQTEEGHDFGFGIIWGHEKSDAGNKYHYFQITNNGYYACGYYNLKWDDMGWKKSPYIKNLEFNTLSVKKKGACVEYYINERLVDTHNMTNADGLKIGLNAAPEQTVCIDHIYFCDSYISTFAALNDYNYYSNLSSAVASRALGICIEYANRTESYTEAVSIMNGIASLDMTPEIRERFNKNSKILSENAKQREEERKFREKQNSVKSLIDYIVNYINSLPNPDDITSHEGKDLADIARDLIDNCHPRLKEIKKVIGQHDNSYMDLSSAVANQALNFCIVYFNRTQNHTIAMEVLKNIDTLDMAPELKKRCSKNTATIYINKHVTKPSTSNVSKPSTSNWCYIATMAYGNVDAPEVVILREYRDNVLFKCTLGRLFIRTYYRYSPSFVSRFKNSGSVSRTIRFILDKIVGRISV